MILADTHVLAWLAAGDDRNPPAGREKLFNLGFSVSAATAWEYEDLHRRGRLPAAAPLSRILTEFVSSVVDFPAGAWTLVKALPPVHRDPVDRMLVAHAMQVAATLATADRNMRGYPVDLLW